MSLRRMLCWALVGLIGGCIISPDPGLWRAASDAGLDAPAHDVVDQGIPAEMMLDQVPTESAPDLVPPVDTGPWSDSAPACNWTGTLSFTAPVPLVDVNSPADDFEPFISADGLTLYFSSMGDTDYDSFIATRPDTSAPFANVVKNLQVSTSTDSETRFALSSNGLEGFLATTRDGGQGGSDIWIATRSSTGDPFAPGDFQPDADLNSWQNEWDPFPSFNGLRLYYAIGSWTNGVGGTEIVVATRASPQDPFAPPESVPGVNSDVNDDNPALTADERVIVFGSRRPGGSGLHDLWYAVRADASATFSTPEPVPALNTADRETEVYITPDGCEIYFASDRPGGQGELDLYYSRLVP